MSEMHLATLFEVLADEVGGDDALRHHDTSLSWSQFDEQAARFAAYLRSLDVGHDAKVALLMRNCPEYSVAQHGTFKERAVPVNVNYRYLDDELRYLLHDAEARVVVAHASLVDRVLRVRESLPLLQAVVIVDDGSADPGQRTWVTSSRPASTSHPTSEGDGVVGWLDVLDAHAPATRLRRGEDDVYLLYTGGTTGMPKGVMFRMGDFVRRMFTGYLYRGWDVPTDAASMVREVHRHRVEGARRVSIPACPLMHGTGMWLGAFYPQLMGGCVVTLPGTHFDADELWTVAQRERVDAMAIVGDAFARPMLDALDRAVAQGRPYRLDDMRIIQSSGVMWSAEVQAGLLRHLDVRLVDSMGSTEGATARRIVTRADRIDTATFVPLPGTRVLVDDETSPSGWRDVVPGSGEQGRVAASAVVPIGYFKDPVKSAATFPEIDGVRYTMAGDWARVEADGRVVLLGRGSGCINTMGEKVYPEEVEEAIKRHPLVGDALVVGLPDERSGQRVAAVVSAQNELTTEQLEAHLRSHLAGYKLPRTVRIVPEVQRAPNGKADYGWARTVLSEQG